MAQFSSTIYINALSSVLYLYVYVYIYILSALLISLFRCFNVHYKKWNWTKCIKYSAIILCIAKNVHRTYSLVEVCRKQKYCNFPDQIIFSEILNHIFQKWNKAFDSKSCHSNIIHVYVYAIHTFLFVKFFFQKKKLLSHVASNILALRWYVNPVYIDRLTFFNQIFIGIHVAKTWM